MPAGGKTCLLRILRVYLRIMRKTLDALFSETRQGLLAALILHPDRWSYASDLARHLGVTPSTIQRDLSAFAEAGILERRTEGRQVYYRPNASCSILPELQSLLLKTAGLVDVLRDALEPHRKDITVAFVHGSLVRGDEVADSDADVMVIGRATLSSLVDKLREAETKLARPVNVNVYSVREYAKKFAEGNHFVLAVTDAAKLFLIGDADDLAGITQQ
jgi:DNA-binding transcriptional ArsR family regulator